MPLAVVFSRALAGVHARLVAVEVHLANGLPNFNIVGLPETAVKEAKDRVRAAIQNGDFDFPNRRITVNLAPADLPKVGGGFDLPIALGILVASGQVRGTRLPDYEFMGELALNGELRAVNGALAMTLSASRSDRVAVLPRASAAEGALAGESRVLAAGSLVEVCAHLNGSTNLTHAKPEIPIPPTDNPDYSDVKGQNQGKRAMEVAAAGSHSVLLSGPPGTGKSMLAERLPTILPPMTDAEALETAALQSISHSGFCLADWKRRPFRAPHHTASGVALVGGGSHPRPGEVSLALNGVLFLDELPEYAREVLEVLREPLESGRITISRAARQVVFPARFQLVAAMNPCPCGYLGHYSGRCHCSIDQVHRYQRRISGPLLDRIDLHVEIPDLPPENLATKGNGQSSETIRARVVSARLRQIDRQGKANAFLTPREVESLALCDDGGIDMLTKAVARLGLSARGFHRILKIARTIADLAGGDRISTEHMAEAIQYRRRETLSGPTKRA